MHEHADEQVHKSLQESKLVCKNTKGEGLQNFAYSTCTGQELTLSKRIITVRLNNTGYIYREKLAVMQLTAFNKVSNYW
jgi:hypothetical protein